MQAMESTSQVFDLEALQWRALFRLADGSVRDGEQLAIALAVPRWVADEVLQRLQHEGDALPGPHGWALTCSAMCALAMTMPRAAGVAR